MFAFVKEIHSVWGLAKIDRYEKCMWLSFSVRMTNIECTHVDCGIVCILLVYLLCVIVWRQCCC
jgi:hypothetical protein